MHSKSAKQNRLIITDNDTNAFHAQLPFLIQLQTKRLLTATLANKFAVGIRTIYRHIRMLERSGVPILTEDGKGCTLMEGYKILP